MPTNWNNIPEEEPDEIDLAMLRDIETDPECKEFLSAEESARVFNEETLEAIQEVEEMQKHPERYKSYHSVEELFADLLKEDD